MKKIFLQTNSSEVFNNLCRARGCFEYAIKVERLEESKEDPRVLRRVGHSILDRVDLGEHALGIIGLFESPENEVYGYEVFIQLGEDDEVEATYEFFADPEFENSQ